MTTKSEPQYLDIAFKYTFSSPIGPMAGERYIQDIAVEIIKTDEYGNTPVIIGKGSVKILLLSQAINDHYDIFEIFDTESYIMRIGNMIYDFDNYEIKEDLQRKLFGDDMMINPNICIFERMMILPEYRGLGIGAKFVKDRFHYFNTACGLIVMQPFPLQLEPSHALGIDNDFESRMGYEELGKDENKAKKSLMNFYKKVGFLSVKGYDDLMFLLPGFKNKKLDAIDLNESIAIR